MAVPIDDLINNFLDETTDDPSQARVELNNLLLKVKALLAAIGVGANNALKLDSNGNIPTGVLLANALAIVSGGTGATTPAQALLNLGLVATAEKINYTNVATLGNAQPNKCVTSNAAGITNLNDFTFFTTTLDGTASAFTLTSLGAYDSVSQMFNVRPHVTNNDNATLSINGFTAGNLITVPFSNNIIAGQMVGGRSYVIEVNGDGRYLVRNPSTIESTVNGICNILVDVTSFMVMPFNIVYKDLASEYNNTTYQFIPKQTGTYLVLIKILWINVVAGDQMVLSTLINGNKIKNYDARINDTFHYQNVEAVLNLTVGDVLEIKVGPDSIGTTAQISNYENYFNITRISS